MEVKSMDDQGVKNPAAGLQLASGTEYLRTLIYLRYCTPYLQPPVCTVHRSLSRILETVLSLRTACCRYVVARYISESFHGNRCNISLRSKGRSSVAKVPFAGSLGE